MNDFSEASNATPTLTGAIDFTQAKQYCDTLIGGDSSKIQFTWQSIDDDRTRKDPRLTVVLYGTLKERSTQLEDRNRRGAGIYITVNEIRAGAMRRAENVICVRALFVDLDSAPIGPVKDWKFQPHIIVESSPGKYHAYWRVDGVKLEEFGMLQSKLATLFNGDPSICDLPRILRVPGFWHRKGRLGQPCQPFMTRIIEAHPQAPSYSRDDLVAALKGVEERTSRSKAGRVGPRVRLPREELSPLDYLNQVALDRIKDWAPFAFPGGEMHGTGAYRVRPSELGRECEEDLSIAPNGIRDFGQEWGVPVGYTPVGLLQGFFHPGKDGELEPANFDETDKPSGTLSEDAACRWLAAQLDLDWDALRAEDAQIMFAEPPYRVEEFCSLDVREIRQRAADLALLKFGYWDRYNEVAARLEPGISRRELDQIADGKRDQVEPRNQSHGAVTASRSITATPFVLPDPKTIEPRAWLYDHHFIRKYLSTTVAPGGLGKTSLLTVEAVAMVTGRNLLGEKPKSPLRVWYWNGEDPIDEMVRRITAVCEHYQITRADLGNRLFVNSGRETEILVARQDRNGIVIAEPVMAALRKTIRDRRIDVVIIDPFVASHAVPENDNIALNAVCWQWRMLAEETGCAVELVHHVRKRAPGQGEFLVDDARGAGAMTNAARSARVLNNMTKDEASKAGLPSPIDFFRVDKGKANNARKSEGATWRRIISMPLGNGRGPSEPGDFVGVVTEWKWPDPEDDVMPDDICAIHQALADGKWRWDAQATDWVGKLVAQQLGLDLDEPSAKAKVKALVKTWLDAGILKLVEHPDTSRRPRKFVEAGKKGGQ